MEVYVIEPLPQHMEKDPAKFSHLETKCCVCLRTM